MLVTIVPGISESVVIEPIISSDNMICYSQDAGEVIRNHIDDTVYNTLVSVTRFQANCGDGIWHQVANLDMTNISQSCPSSGYVV